MAPLSYSSFSLHFFFLSTVIAVALFEPQMFLALLWQTLCELFIRLENCFCLSGQASVEDIWDEYSVKKVPLCLKNR